MSERAVYHVKPHEKGWAVAREGSSRATAVTGTKAEAVDKARQVAKAQPLGQVKVHKQDGTFQTEYTYGKDPERTPG